MKSLAEVLSLAKRKTTAPSPAIKAGRRPSIRYTRAADEEDERGEMFGQGLDGRPVKNIYIHLRPEERTLFQGLPQEAVASFDEDDEEDVTDALLLAAASEYHHWEKLRGYIPGYESEDRGAGTIPLHAEEQLSEEEILADPQYAYA